MINDESSLNDESLNQKVTFDLEERTLDFGKAVVRFSKKIPESIVTRVLITQFTKSGTSVGANYCEANNGESKDDFKHKIGICKKESRETMYWLSLITEACPDLRDETKILWKEAKELTLIFGAIIRTSRKRK